MSLLAHRVTLGIGYNDRYRSKSGLPPRGDVCIQHVRQSCVQHFLRPAQELDVELAAGEQHIVQRFADIAGFDGCAAIAHDACLRDASHQLLDERGADALGPLRGLSHDGIVERQTPAIELDELLAADIVRKRHLSPGRCDRGGSPGRSQAAPAGWW